MRRRGCATPGAVGAWPRTCGSRRGRLDTNRSNNAAGDVQPTWKPDATKIAFVTDRDGDNEIYVMNADGFGQTNITNDPASSDQYPDWRRTSGPGADFDLDGCTDDKEARHLASSGGLRNPQSFWDFFDTPRRSARASGSGTRR